MVFICRILFQEMSEEIDELLDVKNEDRQVLSQLIRHCLAQLSPPFLQTEGVSYGSL